jgi:hypothetical protein
MRKVAYLMAALGALGAVGAASPASAAMGQCFDAYGRPASAPYSTDNPPYGLFCAIYRRGGTCTGVQPQWAEANCGIRPRYNRYDYQYQYQYPRGYYDRGYNRYYPNRYDGYDYYNR